MSESLFQVSGLSASSFLYFIAQHFQSGLVVLPRTSDLHSLQEVLIFMTKGEIPVHIFPPFERIYEPIRQEPQTALDRLQTQWCLLQHSKVKPFVLTTREALSQKTLSPKELQKAVVEVEKNKECDREALIRKLESLGYRRDDLAEDQGFFSVRGHLLDIFSHFEKVPFRIEFFGDEVVSIRTFDPETQRSLSELNAIQLLPCRELVLHDQNWKTARDRIKDLADSEGFDREERERILSDLEHHREISEPRWLLPAFSSDLTGLADYLPKNLPLIHVDADKAKKEWADFHLEEDKYFKELKRLAFEPSTLRTSIEEFENIPHHEIDTLISAKGLAYEVQSLETLRSRLLQSHSFLPLSELLSELRDKDISAEIVLQSAKREVAVREALGDLADKVQWSRGPLFSGFSSSTFRKAFITEQDIFGAKRKRSSFTLKSTEDFLRQFSDLKDGDFIIHEDHGIGKFRGLQKLTIQTVTSEFLVLEYADADKLYLPIYRVDKLARYVGEGFANPRLDKLGSQTFSKQKSKIKKDIFKIAHELLEIAASRKLNKVERTARIREDLYQDFAELFPYELTPDQEKAVQEIENDFREPFPADRLVCGDVGFGKTEVAMRAAMLSLLQGRQVAVLAPTTILVEQHFRTFSKRFEKFPFKIAHVSRFLSTHDQRHTLDLAKEGKIDLIIGTHRLLQPDAFLPNLGLLIVDEEQRFGVKHKERLKKMRATTDILTLSATPIPRTLQMSIFGIRELSLITTPPEMREAVRTYVGAFDEKLIRNASLKELQRGGQILFVHNRVQTIDGVADRLRKLLPECRIVVAHGQMNETDLENRVVQFIEQKADVLVATTIIENGLDIANANTLFVDHAEIFGLSDLYQLRGRVGRSHRSSYAYFLIHENTALTEEASKRLQVIQSCTELGSGFHVATHDMEIRGAGNLLGEEQSGIVSEVGLELYSQMLQETLAEIRHQGVPEAVPELNSGYTAYIPEDYIPDASIRIATYKRLNKVKTPKELLDLEDELLDRFGLYPKEVDNLCQLLRIRTIAQALKAQTVDVFPGRLNLILSPATPLQAEKIFPLLKEKKLSLDPKGRLTFNFESALKNSKLVIANQTSQSTPELVDFGTCRRLLLDLCKRSDIALEAV